MRTLRLTAIALLFFVSIMSAWGFVENAWAAGFRGPNSAGYLHRAEVFLWCGCVSFGMLAGLATWKLFTLVATKFRRSPE
jgi:hypothetical protein